MKRMYFGCRHDGGKRVEVSGTGSRRQLVDRHHRDTAFGWGRQAAGSVSLARAILMNVLGEECSEGMAITFAGDVLAELPDAAFVLGETDVRDWLDGQQDERMDQDELFEHVASIALVEPERETEVLRGLIDRCWTARSLTN